MLFKFIRKCFQIFFSICCLIQPGHPFCHYEASILGSLKNQIFSHIFTKKSQFFCLNAKSCFRVNNVLRVKSTFSHPGFTYMHGKVIFHQFSIKKCWHQHVLWKSIFLKLKLKVLMSLRKFGKFHLQSICCLENDEEGGRGV